MKTLLTIILFISLGLCISCDLGLGIHEPTELEKLPPLTTSGENTFGCLVNGEALIADHSLDITAIYQQGKLQLGGGQEDNDIDKDLDFVLEDPLEENVFYELTNFPIHRSKFRDRDSSKNCLYDFENTFKGHLTFTKIDRTNFIISGTFEFSTVTEDCDTVHITDGRFDMQYIP